MINDAKKYALIKIIDYPKTTKVNSEEKIRVWGRDFHPSKKRKIVSHLLTQCYIFVNAIPMNPLFDVGIRSIYTKTENNQHKNCYCLCCDANYGWIKHYLNDHFRFSMCPCKKQKPQGLISHLYHRALKNKTPCPFHATAYYHRFLFI